MSRPVSRDKDRVIDNWDHLVREALKSEELRASSRTRTSDELGGVVPPSLGQASNINIILQAAEEIQPDDPQVARICTFSSFCTSCLHVYFSAICARGS